MKSKEPDRLTLAAAAHVYVHVPFCAAKCAYCSFYSVPLRPAAADTYLQALEKEMVRTLQGSKPRVDTLYIGGGTPTMMADEQLERLVRIVASSLTVSRRTEWTIEANPATLTKKRLALFAEVGINRISVGVQTLLDPVLRTLDRPHSVSDVEATARLLREQDFTNFGFDLIAGLPGVSREAWHGTLSRAIGMGPKHVSVYTLSLERGTRLAAAVRHGAVTLPDEDAVRFAMESACSTLDRAHFHRYELSNFAQSGFECKHNLACWRGGDYLGFGPAAASRVGQTRRRNRADLKAYVSALSAGRKVPGSVENVDAETDCSERLAFAFRLAEGVNPSAYAGDRSTAVSRIRRWEEALNACAADGLVSKLGPLWIPTRQGLLFADTIAERILPG